MILGEMFIQKEFIIGQLFFFSPSIKLFHFTINCFPIMALFFLFLYCCIQTFSSKLWHFLKNHYQKLEKTQFHILNKSTSQFQDFVSKKKLRNMSERVSLDFKTALRLLHCFFFKYPAKIYLEFILLNLYEFSSKISS